MSRAPQTFKQRDVAAAIRAAQQAGLQVKEVMISRDGQIRLIIAGETAEEPKEVNPWDKYYADPPSLR
jgi:hypothetical protein